MKRRRAFDTVMVPALALGVASAFGCTGDAQGDDPNPPSTVESNADDIAAVEVALTPDQEVHTIGRAFQSGRFLVTVGHVVHDRATGTILVGLRFENLSERWEAIPGDGVMQIDGRELYVFLDSSARVPPGVSAEVTGRVEAGAASFTDATLVWGRPDETRTRIPLDGTEPDGFGLPLDLAVDAWAQIGRHSVHISGAALHPDALRAPRAEPGHHVLRVFFDEYTSASTVVNGFWPVAHFRLRWPDGTEVEPLSGSTGRAPLSWTTSTAMSVDLPVPVDAAGDYELLLASVSRDAFAVFHPELVERIAAPITIPELELGPAHVDPAVALPWPSLDEATPVTEVLPDAVDLPLDTDAVNIPGVAFRPRRVGWDPATSTATVDGLVEAVPAVVPPDDGLLSTPLQFAPNVALLVGGRVHGGLIVGPVPTVPVDAPVAVAYEFPGVERFDPLTAALVVGEDGMQPSYAPLGPDAPFGLDPPAPVELPIDAPEVTAGNYEVRLVGYRFGFPRALDRPPVGWRSLEIIAEVTARQVEDPGPFGLGFSGRTQLFLTRDGGWLQQSEAHDTVFLEPDETALVGATFRVPAGWRPGPTTFTVRSLDEITALTRNSWVEVTFTADLLGGDDRSTG